MPDEVPNVGNPLIVIVGRIKTLTSRAIMTVTQNPLLLGLISVAWLILRTGTKPTRISYPCQRAALTQSYLLFACYISPTLAIIPKNVARLRQSKKIILLLLISSTLVVGASLWFFWKREERGPSLEIKSVKAQEYPASTIFAVNDVSASDCHPAVLRLIDLMSSNGLYMYKSETKGNNKDPSGMIGNGDIVIIKVNSQWSERGGTNTDLVKALIKVILEHPDGFNGEIVIADNGQGRGSMSWSQSNAEDHAQSFEKLADYFPTYKVSTYLWDKIAGRVAQEYSEGDLEDGYVITKIPLAGASSKNQNVSYPKFSTKYGTYISFGKGIWDPNSRSYHSSKLKVINVPVLKSHSGYGFTAAIKHYMGVVSQSLTNAHSVIGYGAMGTELANSRYPVLNIIDAIWINARPGSGPATSYSEAVRTNLILASTDPIALDTWATTHVLSEIARKSGFGSGEIPSFNPYTSYLKDSMSELQAYGYPVTMDEKRIEICATNAF